ncbi:hypothetical protein [Streptomyces salyersiae]|uniref:HK97 gp10 family phage protein n=1 Tax=Streptomyces salyersiae TaxID=3075530 RepID=A0ABU2RVE4_9ACTN|nr:hypothetical protein [Streptomyces sp. DSM 41770]MDT0432805.1 hypothetical protein [Streptomyces sp. DSM 41770]
MTQRNRLSWNGDTAVRRIQAGEVLGLRLAAEHVLQVSRGRVPIEEATLERSGTASVDEAAGTAGVSYDTPYAVRQHEDMTLRHDAGRTAKFLEKSVDEEAGAVLNIVAAQVRRALRG